MIKLFVIHDQPVFIQGIINIIQDQKEIRLLGFGYNLITSMQNPSIKKSDIILLKTSLHNADIQIGQKIKKQFPQVQILAQIPDIKQFEILKMVNTEITGFILQSCSTIELIQAIQNLYLEGQYFPNNLIAQLFSTHLRHVKKRPNLTKREKEIVTLIYHELTTAEIATRLFISTSTVETHRMNAIAKLHARNTAGLIKNAIKYGYVEPYLI